MIEEELVQGTVQSLYNTPHYNTDLVITWSCDRKLNSHCDRGGAGTRYSAVPL